MGSKEAYVVLSQARCGMLDDSQRLLEAQRVTGHTIGDLREGPAPASAEDAYGNNEVAA